MHIDDEDDEYKDVPIILLIPDDVLDEVDDDEVADDEEVDALDNDIIDETDILHIIILGTLLDDEDDEPDELEAELQLKYDEIDENENVVVSLENVVGILDDDDDYEIELIELDDKDDDDELIKVRHIIDDDEDDIIIDIDDVIDVNE